MLTSHSDCGRQTALDAFKHCPRRLLCSSRRRREIACRPDWSGCCDRAVERQPPHNAALLRRPVGRDGSAMPVSQPHVHLTNTVKFETWRRSDPRASCTRLSGSFSMRSRLTLDRSSAATPTNKVPRCAFPASRLPARALAKRVNSPARHGALHATTGDQPGAADHKRRPHLRQRRSRQVHRTQSACASRDRCEPAAMLRRDHCANAAFADRGQQTLEARPIDPTTRAAKIIVDDLNRSPVESLAA